jgi:hypothetical protein
MSLFTSERAGSQCLFALAFIGTALLCLPYAKAQATASKPIYASKAYSVWSDHVTEGPYVARALSRTEIVSNYPVDAVPAIERRWSLDEDISSYPQLHSGFLLGDALYALSLAELRKDQRADGAVNAGARWEGVWTRDVSYSTLLSLAIVAPEGAKASLRQKVRRGRIVQDTGTGGSWPVSTDRVTWALAAWEIYTVTGDRKWLRESYTVIRNSILDDEHVVLDPTTGLAHGESSFLDWREQTYPRWMQPADIYASECLGTNAVYFRTYQVLGAISRELGLPSLHWKRQAERIRQAINTRLWQEDRGYYGQYLYGRLTQSLSPRSEALGEALAILFDIAPPTRQARLLRSQTFMSYGVPTVYPETPGIPPYHNRSVWPFVQSFWNLAAAKGNDEPLLLYGLAALERESALFLTNKENFVSDTGSPQGTVINSDRQLWSVAGNLAMVYRVLFGLEYEADGLYFHPFVPMALAGPRTLSNFTYRHARLTIEVRGFGAHIRRFTLDGEEQKPIVPASIRGDHSIVIDLDNSQSAATPIRVVEDATAPDTPQARLQQGSIDWSRIPNASSYQLYANGSAVETTRQTHIALPAPSRLTEYQLAALDANRQSSFLSEPLSPASAAVQIPASPVSGSGDLSGSIELDRQHPNLAVVANIPADGRYSLAVQYSNGSGPINTDNKCAIRTLFVDGRAVGPVILPQRGDGRWDDWGWSNRLQLLLAAGRHSFELRFMPEDANMNGQVNTARIKSLELQRTDFR